MYLSPYRLPSGYPAPLGHIYQKIEPPYEFLNSLDTYS